MPIVLFDDLDESTAWGWLEPVHDGLRKPLVGQEVTIGRADIQGADDARGVSKYHFKVRHFPQGAGTILTDLSSNGTYINGVRIEKDKDAALVHADLITLAHATTARFAFRFCAANKELPALGSTGSSHNVVGVFGVLPARMASALTAERALLDAKQAEVDEWCAQFAAETGRQPNHPEKLAGIPSYKVCPLLIRSGKCATEQCGKCVGSGRCARSELSVDGVARALRDSRAVYPLPLARCSSASSGSSAARFPASRRKPKKKPKKPKVPAAAEVVAARRERRRRRAVWGRLQRRGRLR